MTDRPAEAPDAATLTQRNRALVEGMYAASLRGDIDAVRQALAEDLTVHEPGFLPYGGTYQGIDRFFELVGRINEHLDFSQATTRHVAAEGDIVIAGVAIPDRTTGRTVDLLDVATVRDDKIVQLKIYFHDAQSLAAASTTREP